MIHVFAGAAKNTRSAVGPMREILLIDKGNSFVRNFEKSLTKNGFKLIKEKSLEKAITFMGKKGADLVVIDGDFLSKAGNSGKLRQLTADKPRIVLINDNNLKDLHLWIKDRFTLPLFQPVSGREFGRCMENLLKNKAAEDENRILQTELKARKKELDFYDENTRNLTAVSVLTKKLNSIMEKVKTLTGAEAVSLLLNDEPFFKIIPIRTSSKIQKSVFKKGVGIAGIVLYKGITLAIKDVGKDKRFNKTIDKFSTLKIKSLICAPLKIKDRGLGVLRLINKKHGDVFTDNDMDLLINAANYAAVDIEMAFLNQEIRNDDLTNLYNIRYLRQAVDMEIERAQRYGSLFSLIFMDLDNLKKVNDKYGHLVGSSVIIEVSRILQKNLRKIDTITRYGGDEFVMILPQTPLDACYMVAERLRMIIEKTEFLKNDGYSVRLTGSFGIASYPANAKNKDELLKLADEAMYHGKSSTKNIVYKAT
jgi:diguanylate cyclase (GGDEF)-like protein